MTKSWISLTYSPSCLTGNFAHTAGTKHIIHAPAKLTHTAIICRQILWLAVGNFALDDLMFWMMIILAAFAGALVVTPCNYCPGQCGVKIGKRKKLSPEQVAELQSRREQGVLIKTLMKEYDLSKTSIYRYLSETAPTPYAPDS